MSQSVMILHQGAREVSLADLSKVPTPACTASWFPVPHQDVVTAVSEQLRAGGFDIKRSRFALSRNDSRLFATLDLGTPVSTGVTLSVGVRNSLDKSLPLGFCAGSRVFVCDNLAFRSELLVNRRHTRHGELRFSEAISNAVRSLSLFKEVEEKRIRRFRNTVLSSDVGDAIILQAYKQDVISHRVLPRICDQWDRPSVEYDADPRSGWALLNAFTFCLADVAKTNMQRFAHLTMKLQHLLDSRPEFAQSV